MHCILENEETRSSIFSCHTAQQVPTALPVLPHSALAWPASLADVEEKLPCRRTLILRCHAVCTALASRLPYSPLSWRTLPCSATARSMTRFSRCRACCRAPKINTKHLLELSLPVLCSSIIADRIPAKDEQYARSKIGGTNPKPPSNFAS